MRAARSGEPLHEQAAGQLLVDIRDGAHDEPAVVAVDEALEQLGREVLLGSEDDLVSVTPRRCCSQAVDRVGVAPGG